jgi:hypothetical protein
MASLTLVALRDSFAVCKMSPDGPIPAWAASGSLVSITRTRDELSIVCPEEDVPVDVTACERAWRCLRVAGQIDFGMVGVLASLVDPLAKAGIPVFVLSTFDTDYLLIKSANFLSAAKALQEVGHDFNFTTPV